MTLVHPPAGDRPPEAGRAAELDRRLAALLADAEADGRSAPPATGPPDTSSEPAAALSGPGETPSGPSEQGGMPLGSFEPGGTPLGASEPGGVALAAVGSHGRRELTPGGDLDLVLLHRGRPDIAEIADRVWYPIWDSGLRLDHSVRTVAEARTVARGDLKAALGLLSARRIAGDHVLVDELRAAVLADWRADARARLPELAAMCRERWEKQGELAFLLEPDLKEARGGLRDVHVMRAVAASWIASAPDGRVMAAHDLLLDIRHALHEVTGRATDRLVLQEQEAVARTVGMPDADALLRAIAGAARTITYAADQLWRRVERATRQRRAPLDRRPVGDGAVEHDDEVVLARNADLNDPALILRVAAAAAQAGLPLAPATVARLAADAAAGHAADDRVADPQRAALHQHG
ncbi:[protein-PII] uridylyltransferase family protein, partial [Actinomadura napierensis]